VREIVEGALSRALELNRRYRKQLDALVAGLLERETLDLKEVQEIFGPANAAGDDPEVGIAPQQPATIQQGATPLRLGRPRSRQERATARPQPMLRMRVGREAIRPSPKPSGFHLDAARRNSGGRRRRFDGFGFWNWSSPSCISEQTTGRVTDVIPLFFPRPIFVGMGLERDHGGPPAVEA
jgi:hypothetical protein